jgi:putative transposase
VLGQVRRTQRYAPILSDEETALVTNVVSLATEYGRYGYRRITALLRADGWPVNPSRRAAHCAKALPASNGR